MSFVLKGNINTRIWARSEECSNLSWLTSEEVVADLILDFRIFKGELSVWRIEDDRSNLDRVIAALAATRDNPAHYAYTLIDKELLRDKGFNLEPTAGTTLDDKVNTWHFDIVELSTQKAADLANTFFHHHVEQDEKFKDEVTDLVSSYAHLYKSKGMKKWVKSLL